MLATILHPYEVERFQLRHLKKLLKKTNDLNFNPRPDAGHFFPTSSGKAALCLALQDLFDSGKLNSKNDNILVPQWLDYWTYYIVQPYAFPVIEPTGETKAMLVSHQYGFPQDMDALIAFADKRDLTVIEDCTQAIDGLDNRKSINTIGNYAIFSFSNFFPCIMGGGLWVQDPEAIARIQKRMAGDHNKFLQAWSICLNLYFEIRPTQNRRILGSGYAICAQHPRMNKSLGRLVSYDMMNGAIEKRKKNWECIRESLSGLEILDDLEPDVVPFAVPAKIYEKHHKDVLKDLIKLGIKTNFLNFDAGRNMLLPELEKRLVLPIHQGLKNSEILLIADTIKNIQYTGLSAWRR